MSSSLAPFAEILRKSGYKLTRQKKIILTIIKNCKMHISAKQIYEKVKEINIGLATVYRTVKIFNELGIVKEINIGGSSYYEMKIFSKNSVHAHFKCCKCNCIIDIEDETLNSAYLKLKNKIEAENHLNIEDLNIIFEGVCNKCKQEGKLEIQSKA